MQQLEALAKPLALFCLFHAAEVMVERLLFCCYGRSAEETKNFITSTMFMIMQHIVIEALGSQALRALHALVELIIVRSATSLSTPFTYQWRPLLTVMVFSLLRCPFCFRAKLLASGALQAYECVTAVGVSFCSIFFRSYRLWPQH